MEDNLINRGVLGSIFSPVYRMLEVENDGEGLASLKGQKVGLSLILLDIVMSVMDGCAFLSHVKSDTELAPAPAVVTTQDSSEVDEVAALSYSAADFVSKSYQSEVILYRVTNIISLRETAAMVSKLQCDRLTGLLNREYFCRYVRDQLDAAPGKMYDIICSNIENPY